jgi:RNA polymerase sigma-54 factor
MALAPRIEIRQSQSLTLTPQLMQSIRLLQLSHLDLEAFIDTELLRNPLLEREDGEPADSAPPEATEPALEALADSLIEDQGFRTADGIAEGLDTDVENVFPEQTGQDTADPFAGARPGNGSDSGEPVDFAQFVASRPTLADHLAEQISHLIADPAERLIARYLIDALNEAGYLVVELEAIAEQLGAPLELVESILARVQGCEPVGVFARNVPECLALQLRERDRLDPLMARLLGHLELVATHDMSALARAVGCDRDDLQDMLAELRELDPRPGRAFDTSPVEAVVPDVFVRRGPDGNWAIDLNDAVLPRVLVNRIYHADVSRRARNPGEKTFLADCLANANWLTKSLEQRAQTILKVSAEIVRQQDGFLERGVTHLRPMTLKMVADAIEMHESTVSRVTSNKYLATPRGLFEMKYFFTTALGSTSGGDEHSAEAVRHRIRQLVEHESVSDVLSDDTIAELLQKEQGIDVARRTVAKYREGMSIPSSVVRRRQKREMAD